MRRQTRYTPSHLGNRNHTAIAALLNLFSCCLTDSLASKQPAGALSGLAASLRQGV